MGKNKTGKYLKYAIGEIMLVVIGILIALSINNWNQQRIQNNEEQVALINLKQDFKYNHYALDSVLTLTYKKIEQQFVILNHTGNKPKPNSEFEFNILLNALTDTKEFLPRNSYLNNLVNSGSLGIIKNQDLRNKLSSWNSVYNNIKVQEAQVQASTDRVSLMVIKNGSWLNADTASNSEVVKNNTFPKSGFNIDNRDLLHQLEFENNTENTIYQNDKLKQRQEKGLLLIAEVLELLEKEIIEK
tara:strand:- start:2978 stop:3709 length:732 start_codon:yes stop_codon:yes gene_type:complete